jgi:hypothetical protein
VEIGVCFHTYYSARPHRTPAIGRHVTYHSRQTRTSPPSVVLMECRRSQPESPLLTPDQERANGCPAKEEDDGKGTPSPCVADVGDHCRPEEPDDKRNASAEVHEHGGFRGLGSVTIREVGVEASRRDLETIHACPKLSVQYYLGKRATHQRLDRPGGQQSSPSSTSRRQR